MFGEELKDTQKAWVGLKEMITVEEGFCLDLQVKKLCLHIHATDKMIRLSAKNLRDNQTEEGGCLSVTNFTWVSVSFQVISDIPPTTNRRPSILSCDITREGLRKDRLFDV